LQSAKLADAHVERAALACGADLDTLAGFYRITHRGL
jgi:hypothetical protein